MTTSNTSTANDSTATKEWQPSCSRCTQTGIYNRDYQGKGKLTSIADQPCYEVPSPSSTTSTPPSPHAIVYLPDVFGIFPGTLEAADTYQHTTQNYRVIVVDFFHGHGLSPDTPVITDPSQINPAVKVKLDAWSASGHSMERSIGMSHAVLKALEEDSQVASVQLIGMCYGAHPIVSIITAPSAYTKLKSAVLVHPGDFDTSAVENITIPVALVVAEKDVHFGQGEKIMQVLNDKEVKYQLYNEFPGTTHGFATRPVDEGEAKQKSRAIELIAKWFVQHG
ncbi:hypothetical protein FIBSPDRAFT_1051517 [Athelia psychrophila]|uniref:Dienelactone hydrolase domain-containing protein n=1 Tax=Athelia psychrophila TaxID=1759441 RepID=A0A165Z0Z2_9AGAM|nr:hypothetical protein FIBSPDRAFT_1051517 [Fibularhizoctonia sp. CBS 109695]